MIFPHSPGFMLFCLAPHFSLFFTFFQLPPASLTLSHSSTTTMSNKPSAKAIARLNATTLFPEIKKGSAFDEVLFISQLRSSKTTVHLLFIFVFYFRQSRDKRRIKCPLLPNEKKKISWEVAQLTNMNPSLP